MEPLDQVSQTPTRIPRPTFMAASPRTPSIRAVPYSPMDRVTTAPKMAESYSPSSWPFPKTAKCPSPDVSVATTQHRDAQCTERENMSHIESSASSHLATTSATGDVTTVGAPSRAQDGAPAARRRANLSLDSVKTQIYAPKHGGSGERAEDSRATGAGDHFLQPTAEVPERPTTPTPYSVLRKVSEVSESGTAKVMNDHGRRNGESPSTVSQHQETAHYRSATHSPQLSIDDMDVKRQKVTVVVNATPVPRDEEGRVLSMQHPLSKAGARNSESQHAQYLAAPSSSVQADYGGSDGGTIINKPEGIIVLKSLGTTEAAPNAGASMRNGSFCSRRPTTFQSEIPDLESLRLGPRLRHSRLPLSPSTAVNAGRNVPKSTRKLWTVLGRSRKIMFASAILLELSILNVVASVTAVTASHIEHGYAAAGLVAWAALSGLFVLTFGVFLGVAFLQYRKMDKELVSGENWIEMHLRSRPLPPRPQSEERRRDNGATEAWQKFVQDHEQLRRYVEFLESRIGVLEEGRPNAGRANQGSDTAAMEGGNNAASNSMENGIDRPSNTNPGSVAGGDAPRAKRLTVGGSLSRRQLLQPEESVTEHESWQGSDGNATIPKSDTKASILTELCEAVTQGYSPLSEQMPPGSPQMLQTPNNHTPSGRPRGSTLRNLGLPSRAVFHQRGVHSVDILRGNKEDV